MALVGEQLQLWMCEYVDNSSGIPIYRDRNGAANLSAIRKIVLAALEKVETKKEYSKKGKRLLAAMNPVFGLDC